MSTIRLEPVQLSSNIDAIGYDAASKVLAVQFRGGAIYHYGGVGQDVHNAFRTAQSKGSYFAASIKDKFQSVRVTAPKAPA